MAVRSSPTSCKHRPNETRALFLLPLLLLPHHQAVPLFSTVIFIACNLRNYRPPAIFDRSNERIDAIRVNCCAAVETRSLCRLNRRSNRSSAFPPPFPPGVKSAAVPRISTCGCHAPSVSANCADH